MGKKKNKGGPKVEQVATKEAHTAEETITSADLKLETVDRPELHEESKEILISEVVHDEE